MKKHFWIFLVSLIAFYPLRAQDLAIIDIMLSSDMNNNAPLGVETSVQVMIVNLDSISMPLGDTLIITAIANGDSLELIHILQNGLDSGSSLTLNFGAEQRVFIDTVPNFQVLASVFSSLDTDTSNNTLIENFVPTPFGINDWACISISIVAPASLDTIDLDNNTNLPPALEQVNVAFTNLGEISYLPWSSFDYSIFIEDDITSLNVYLAETGVAPGDTLVRSISNQSILPSIPDSVGVYGLCGVSQQPQDPNPLNDTFCLSIPVVDNFDPNDPFNWPTGKADLETKIEAFQLHWTGFEQTLLARSDLNFTLHNMLGSQLEMGTIGAGDQHRFQHLVPGVYLLQIKSETSARVTEKFVIQ